MPIIAAARLALEDRVLSPAVPPPAGLCVGYLAPGEGGVSPADALLLEQAGCRAIRTESSADGAVLTTLLGFLTTDDLLVLPNALGLPCGYGGLQRLLHDLDTRGVTAVFIAEALRTDGEEGQLLRRAVAAAAELQPPAPPRRPTAAMRGKALAMRAAGWPPGKIARELGISRMTIWRWLKTPA